MVSKAYRNCLLLIEKIQELLTDIPTCSDCEYCLGDMEGNSHCSLDSMELCDGMICPIQTWAFETKKNLDLMLKNYGGETA